MEDATHSYAIEMWSLLKGLVVLGEAGGKPRQKTADLICELACARLPEGVDEFILKRMLITAAITGPSAVIEK